MRCEICGKYILSGKRIKVEGSTVVACENCVGYGEVVKKEEPYKEMKKVRVQQTPLKPRERVEEVETEEILVDNAFKLIKDAREARQWKQEDLAKKINEPASLIHRLESGKFHPSPELINKLGKALNLRLWKKVEVETPRGEGDKEGGELTLGDLVVVKERQKDK